MRHRRRITSNWNRINGDALHPTQKASARLSRRYGGLADWLAGWLVGCRGMGRPRDDEWRRNGRQRHTQTVCRFVSVLGPAQAGSPVIIHITKETESSLDIEGNSIFAQPSPIICWAYSSHLPRDSHAVRRITAGALYAILCWSAPVQIANIMGDV